ncbi:MAG: hypothetical protein QOE70_1075 [Chthoniobacter sp.]|jgi:Fe-S-cluster-containing hydrogenase component 2/CRP-like cAMP-binding protein|nr:hypothetical protein [Chthoniobacter sp.]
MPTIPELVPGLFIRDDDEDLFSRDIDGQLVRLDAPTDADYAKTVTVQIDGQPVTVPLAEPLTDAQGNFVLDLEGRTTPRYTTIYDAAVKLYVQQPGDEAKIPIPTLCHQPHMKPVGVCRLCVVQIYGQKRGKRAAERKLLPACQHQVKEGMEVFTMNAPGPDGARVRQTVKVMTELLSADHLKPAPLPEVATELTPFNELGQMNERCGGDASRFKLDVLSGPRPAARPLAGRRTFDASSPVFQVDHSACILCDRCVRGCDDVMENNVIGRTGKGSNAGIGFDFNDLMGESSCVKCGECMVSCPTSAITYKPVAQIKITAKNKAAEILPARELIADPLFAGVPPKFLLWQQGLVIRRRLQPLEVLCRQGDPGNTAFILKSGTFQVTVYSTATIGGGQFAQGAPVFSAELTPADVIVGEMSCLSSSPRSADVVAVEAGEVWEVRRNVLDRLMRLPSLREKFETGYRERSLELALQSTELFKGIEAAEYRDLVNFFRERLSFVRVRPGQTLFDQGDEARELFLIRLGHVRIGMRRFRSEGRVISSGPGNTLGEIGLLALTSEDPRRPAEEIDREIKMALDQAGGDLAGAFPAGVRMASCSALSHLELARISREDFLQGVRDFPTLRRRVVEQALARLRSSKQGDGFFDDYVDQGLYEAQSVLVLNLDLCTRCDECTRGCVEQHGIDSHGVPLTRLFRDGLRFDKFVVATSCRSCTDAHCMVGCPVDSIHRGRHQQIVIEDHCIGCGLCADNCPYGSIFMMPNQLRRIETPDPEQPGKMRMIAQPKAVNCDLCDTEGTRFSPQPRCVSSCPHDAAHRYSGPELLGLVIEGHQEKRKRDRLSG